MDPIVKLASLLRPPADESLGPLVAWLDTLTDVEQVKAVARVCCYQENPLLGGYSREVVRCAFTQSSNTMFQVLAHLVPEGTPHDVASVEAHLARRSS